ncbi:hypothetical protein ACEU59_14010 [Buttiauxella noackiae]|uniref:hypothetical protein n=1 Tax=Buttiauxella noackiae TaxID=82992 RepID=UPI0035A5E987
MKYLVLIALLFIGHAQSAEKDHKFNPADPAVWQEKPSSAAAQAEELHKALCATFPSAECPNASGNQSDIEREKQRREDNRRYNDREKHFKN